MRERRSLLIKTMHLGIITLISRFFGFFREILLARFFGVGAVADAFHTAIMIPNTLRKIFAEGALSASLSPTLILAERKDGPHQRDALVTLALIASQACLLILSVAMSAYAPLLVRLTAPGFTTEQNVLAVQLTRVLSFFILFVSSSAVLASALQATHRFLVPALSPVVMNILWIIQLLMCLRFNLSPLWFAYALLLDGLLVSLFHVAGYRYAGLSWAWPTAQTFTWFKTVMVKFVPCLITAGSMEISLVIDRILASYLPEGSIALLSYTSAFLRVPLGVLVAGFASILLPRMTQVGTYAPARLGMYLLESAKLVVWVIIPIMLLMMVFSYKTFYTLLLSPAFTVEAVLKASSIFRHFTVGLFFFAMNKILTNIFYALHNTIGPTVITLVGAVCNTLLNLALMGPLGAAGVALATSISAALQTLAFIVLLHYRHRIPLYGTRLLRFLARALLQLGLFSLLFALLYGICYLGITKLPESLRRFMLERYGFWVWVAPLCSLLAGCMYLSRKAFGLRMYFLD